MAGVSRTSGRDTRSDTRNDNIANRHRDSDQHGAYAPSPKEMHDSTLLRPPGPHPLPVIFTPQPPVKGGSNSVAPYNQQTHKSTNRGPEWRRLSVLGPHCVIKLLKAIQTLITAQSE
jgi:hypothetical protein